MKIRADPDWWKHCFDEIYLITDARSVCDPDITRREVDIVSSLLDLHPGDRVLDLCGGHGRHSLELHKRGVTDCTLLDYSWYLIDRASGKARQLGIDLDCVQADARNTGLPSDSFDHVLILGNSLGYDEEPDSDMAILTESRRVLRPGGTVLVDVVDGSSLKRSFNPNAWHEIGDDIIVCRERELVGNRVNAREIVLSRKDGIIRDHTYSIGFYHPTSLRTLLKRAGFNDVHIHTRFSPHKRSGDYGCMKNRMIGIGSKG